MRVSLSERRWRHLSPNLINHLMVVVTCFLLIKFATLPATVCFKTPLKLPECQINNFRLPEWLKPTNYELFIRPNLEHLNFTGKVGIDLVVVNQAAGKQQLTRETAINKSSHQQTSANQYDTRKTIILHADQQLQIRSVQFLRNTNTTTNKTMTRVQVRELCRDSRHDLLVVRLNEFISADGGQLRFSFSGQIRDDLHGFYKSESGDGGGQVIALTQFQAPHARKAFPCFDEPQFKATFKLTLEHEAHLKSLANMQVIGEPLPVYHKVHHHLRVQFAPTPRMSTYLVAWAVGQFDHIDTQVISGGAGSSAGMRLSVWTSPGRAHEAQYALTQAARAFNELRNYFGIEQPLEKIDILAVRELDAGAMENWGLIMFTEQFLFVQEDDATGSGSGGSTPAELLYATDSITHELSHQWFGNLVTMRWWDDLWLNEGFATYITQLINQQLHPRHEGQLIYLLDALDSALKLDSHLSSHPIKNTKLQTVKQIEDSFDDITYEKASAVIRMLNEHLGAKQFKLGIKHYLATHLYENTDARDLWTSLSAPQVMVDKHPHTKTNVGDLVNSWVGQAGFPVISAYLSPNGRILRLEQERFLSLETNHENWTSRRKQKWIVPVSLWLGTGSENGTGSQELVELFQVTLSEWGHSFRLPKWFDISGGWIKVNAQFAGFYRVNYLDARLWRALERPIRDRLMTPADRLNLVSDLSALYLAGKLSLEILDQALEWFDNENNDAVINALARIIAQLEIDSRPPPYDGHNRAAFLVRYYENTGKFSDENDEDEDDDQANDSLLRTRTRGDVASLLVVMQNQQVINDALALFGENSTRPEVPRNFLTAIYAAVASAGSDIQVARMLEMVKEMSTTRKEREQLEAYTRQIVDQQPEVHKKQQVD